jgi:uncharacterized protein YjbJ (UPF0337 family)
MWNKDQIQGKDKKIEGAITEKAGGLVTNPDLEAEGKDERLEGIIQESVGEVAPQRRGLLEKAGQAISGK